MLFDSPPCGSDGNRRERSPSFCIRSSGTTVALGHYRLFLCFERLQGSLVRMENSFFEEQFLHSLIRWLQPERLFSDEPIRRHLP